MVQTAQKLVEQALAEIQTITVDEARDLFGQDNVIFVDIRDVRETKREGMIEGATHAPRGMLEFWIDQTSPYAKPIFAQGEDTPKRFVFYCAMGWRSALATKLAQDMGLANVCHIEGGFSAWADQGGAVEKNHD